MPTWVDGEQDGYPFEAFVSPHGTPWGINYGRVSKLWVYDPDEPDEDEQVIYLYERGDAIDKAPAGLVDKILARFPGQPWDHEVWKRDYDARHKDDPAGRPMRSAMWDGKAIRYFDETGREI